MQPNWRTCCLPLRPTGMQLAGVSCSLARSCSNGGTISQARVRLSLNLHCSCRPAVLPFSNECGRLNGSVSRVPLEKDSKIKLHDNEWMHVVRFEKSCHKCISPLPRRIFPAMEVRDPPERGQHFPREILAVGIIILTKSGRECAHISTADHRCRAASVLFVTVESWKECRLLIARLPPPPLPPPPPPLQFSSGVELPPPLPPAPAVCVCPENPRGLGRPARRRRRWRRSRGGGSSTSHSKGRTDSGRAGNDRPTAVGGRGERGGRNTTPLQCSRTTGSAVSCSLALTGKSLAPSSSQNIFSCRRTS